MSRMRSGLEIIKNPRQHDDLDIHARVYYIMEEYLPNDEDTDIIVRP